MFKKLSVAALLLLATGACSQVVLKPLEKSEKGLVVMVGNNAYSDSLKNSINDERAIGHLFGKWGYGVLYFENLTKDSFDLMKKRVEKRLSTGGYATVVFFYSGHGSEADEEGMCLQSVDGHAIPLSDVVEVLSVCPTAVCIIDACRELSGHSSPLSRSGPSSSLHKSTNQPIIRQYNNIVTLYACAKGQIAWDEHPKRKNNGLFTGELLDFIEKSKDLLDINAFLKAAETNNILSDQQPSLN